MTHLLDWKRAEDPRDVVHLAVQALAEGHLVGLPTDTLYNIAASGIDPTSIPGLQALRIRNPAARPTIAIRSVDEAMDYSPQLSPVGFRLAKCLWPGPFGLVVDGSHPDSLVRRLPANCQKTLLDDAGRITLRSPAHDAVAHVMHLLAGPLVLLAAPPNGVQHPTLASSVELSEVSLAIDDGVTHYRGPSTCVHVEENRCRIVSPGVLDQQALVAMSQFVILLVCTGNTCRSPMAERLLQAKLEKKLGTSIGAGKSCPMVAKSAGVNAMPGCDASPQAIEALHSFGLDLSNHQSTQISERLLNRADLILTMTSNHRNTILSRWPAFEDKLHLLANQGGEVADPFGSSVETYRECAKQLDRYLDHWVDRIPTDSLAIWV